MSTQIVEENVRQFSGAYERTQQILSENPEMTGQVWADALQELDRINVEQPNRSMIAKAHAAINQLEQVLVATAARGGFNGTEQQQ